MNKKMFVTVVLGTITTILCCSTPLLVILLGSIGLSAITGYLHYVLIPVLVVFMLITINSYKKSTKPNL